MHDSRLLRDNISVGLACVSLRPVVFVVHFHKTHRGDSFLSGDTPPSPLNNERKTNPRPIIHQSISTNQQEMSTSRPIPGGSSKNPGSSSHDFSTSFVASFRSSSPIAQEVIARDLAACSDDEDLGDAEANGHGLDVSDSEIDGDNPLMYRRPSGIAFGTARPVLAAQNVEDSILTRNEWKQSLDAERSLLRDNHILPPKHAHPEQLGLLGRLRKRFFSTKVPRPSGSDEEAGPDPAGIPTEESPLLGGSGDNTLRRHSSSGPAVEGGHLSETWEAAVAAGHIKTTWQREAKTLAVYSRSLVVTFLLQYSVNITSILAVGRIGKVELGAVSCEYIINRLNYSAYRQTSAYANSINSGHNECKYPVLCSNPGAGNLSRYVVRSGLWLRP